MQVNLNSSIFFTLTKDIKTNADALYFCKENPESTDLITYLAQNNIGLSRLLLEEKVITIENNKFLFYYLINNCSKNAESLYYLIYENIITKELGVLYSDCLEKCIKDDHTNAYNLLRSTKIVDGDVLFEEAIRYCISNVHIGYCLIRNDIIKKDKHPKWFNQIVEECLKFPEYSHFVLDYFNKDKIEVDKTIIDRLYESCLTEPSVCYYLLLDEICTVVKDKEYYRRVMNKCLESTTPKYAFFLLQRKTITKTNDPLGYLDMINKCLNSSYWRKKLRTLEGV